MVSLNKSQLSFPVVIERPAEVKIALLPFDVPVVTTGVANGANAKLMLNTIHLEKVLIYHLRLNTGL